MIWLQLEDFETLIKTGVLDRVTGSKDELLDKAEQIAIEEISSYLGFRYDTTALFETTGTGRNSLILAYCIDITLYHLHSRNARIELDEVRLMRYEAAINWLKMVSAGKLQPDLPPLKTESGEVTSKASFISVDNKRNNQY